METDFFFQKLDMKSLVLAKDTVITENESECSLVFLYFHILIPKADAEF